VFRHSKYRGGKTVVFSYARGKRREDVKEKAIRITERLNRKLPQPAPTSTEGRKLAAIHLKSLEYIPQKAQFTGGPERNTLIILGRLIGQAVRTREEYLGHVKRMDAKTPVH
jgi:hypothetical protein